MRGFFYAWKKGRNMSKATGPNPEEREYPIPAQGHALPQDQWDKVVADAERIRAEADESETE